MPVRHNLTGAGYVPEGATVRITTTIRDLDDVALPAASLATVTVIVYDADSLIVLRARASILNVNGGTVNTAGGLTLRLDPADTAIVGASGSEWHVALIEWTWIVSAVTYYGKAQLAHRVVNLAKVPAA